RCKESFSGESGLESLDAGEQVPQAHRSDLIAHHLQIAAAHPPLRLRMDHYASAVAEIKAERIELSCRKRRFEGHVLVGIAEGDNDEVLPPLHVEHLPLDPYGAHARDVLTD